MSFVAKGIGSREGDDEEGTPKGDSVKSPRIS
jgi:hypothetical protein